ncbi:MAG: flagellar hook-basal body complex protein [Gemmatimonadales bacterium]|nr:MAG: flagellar hook-basal body complex protein [Gemmatimonadales bacterium]
MMEDPRVLAATSRALGHLELRQQVSAHNLANASTPGFRGDRVFARLMADGGGPDSRQARDETRGAVNSTGRPLDLVLDGPGHLVVRSPEGERLSRAGALSIDSAGYLVDAGGRPVLGTRGPILLPPGEPRITQDGEIHVDGGLIERLRVEVPGEGEPLARDAGGLLVVPEGRDTVASQDTRLRQGFLEDSNVNPIQAMTEMIDIQRSFATLQRSVHVLDGILERVANDLGRLR